LPWDTPAHRWRFIHHHVVNYKLTFRISSSTTYTQIVSVHTLYTIMPSEVQVTTMSLPRTTLSENDEFLILIEHCLPDDMKNLWFASEDMETVARTGGLTNLPGRFVSNALKSSKFNTRGWVMNRFTQTCYYCFAGSPNTTAPRHSRTRSSLRQQATTTAGGAAQSLLQSTGGSRFAAPRDPRFASPRKQRDFLKTASAGEKVDFSLPEGYFLKFDLKFMAKYTSSGQQESIPNPTAPRQSPTQSSSPQQATTTAGDAAQSPSLSQNLLCKRTQLTRRVTRRRRCPPKRIADRLTRPRALPLVRRKRGRHHVQTVKNGTPASVLSQTIECRQSVGRSSLHLSILNTCRPRPMHRRVRSDGRKTDR